MCQIGERLKIRGGTPPVLTRALKLLDTADVVRDAIFQFTSILLLEFNISAAFLWPSAFLEALNEADGLEEFNTLAKIEVDTPLSGQCRRNL